VVVEAKPDFSTYVWAEVQFEGSVAFPTFDEKVHFFDNSTAKAPSYTPTFGTNGESFVFTPRGSSDPTSYLTTAWPVMPPTCDLLATDSRPRITPGVVVDGQYHYEGSRVTYRYGYRNDEADVVVGEMIHFLNAGTYRYGGIYGFSDTISISSKDIFTGTISCCWEDIEEEQQNGMVRCGYSNSTVFWPGYRPADVGEDPGFSFGFSVPRSLFVDSESSAEPKPYDIHRYVGLEQSGSAATVFKPRPYPSYLLERVSSAVFGAQDAAISVTCSADSAAVIIDPADSDHSAVPLFSLMSGAESSPVTASTPFFSRRPDLVQRNSVPSGDTWHASHLIRKGSSLATPSALHQLNIEFVEIPLAQELEFVFHWEYPAGRPVRPVYDLYNYYFVNSTPPSCTCALISDYGHIPEYPTYITNSYDLSLWNLLSGTHSLSASLGGSRLVPNTYCKFSSSATRSVSVADSFNGLSGEVWSTVLMPKATFAEWRAHSCPDDRGDWRASWTLESYPQIWAWTRLPIGNMGPLQSDELSLDNSGMTTESYDKYSISGWPFIDLDRGAVIRVQARIGAKILLDQVRWYRAAMRFQQEVGYPIADGSYAIYEATGGVESGSVSCGDSAVTEYFYNVDIPLTSENVAAISGGETVEVQIDSQRTAKVSVSIAE
jgi:hypothetical protein